MGKVERRGREGRTSVNGSMRRGRCCGSALTKVVGKRLEGEGFVGRERFECVGRTQFDLTVEVYRPEQSVD